MPRPSSVDVLTVFAIIVIKGKRFKWCFIIKKTVTGAFYTVSAVGNVIQCSVLEWSKLAETLSIWEGLQLLMECGQGCCGSDRSRQTIPGPRHSHWECIVTKCHKLAWRSLRYCTMGHLAGDSGHLVPQWLPSSYIPTLAMLCHTRMTDYFNVYIIYNRGTSGISYAFFKCLLPIDKNVPKICCMRDPFAIAGVFVVIDFINCFTM